MIIAGAILFSVLPFACKKEKANPYGNTSGNPGGNQVYMQSSKFSPASISVAKGSTITWTNMDNTIHTVTSVTGAFDSGDIGYGKTYSRTFSDVGTFDYNCKYHASMGMTGTVIVH